MNPLLRFAVVKYYVKAPGHRNDQLMQLLVAVTTALSAAGHVVEVVDPTDFKRDVIPTLNESQVTPRIRNLWKLNDLTGVEVEVCRHFWS